MVPKVPLRDSEDHSDYVVAGWESADGTYHTVYDTDGDKVGRAPSDHSLESAERIVIYDGEDEFFTVYDGFNDEYGIDEAIDEWEDAYE